MYVPPSWPHLSSVQMADSSEDEREEFEVTVDDVLFSTQQKKKRRFTKEDATYGIWAPRHDSDDENYVDLTKPVDFVSGSVSGLLPKQEEEKDGDASDPDEQDLDLEAKKILESWDQVKIGRGGQASGVGKFRTAALDKNKKLGVTVNPKAPVSKPAPKKGYGGKPGSMAEKRRQELMRSDGRWGQWEKHTSGFGGRMLAKMGYVPGKGLGRGGEGIVNPVKAVKTTELGTENYKANFSSSSAAVIDEEEEEEERAFQQEIQQWRKTSGGGSTKPKYVYKTLDELKDKGAAMGRRKKGKGGFGSETKVKVIDLTGREARVMDSYEEMRQTKAGDTSTADSQIFIPQLLANLTLLVDHVEAQVLQNARKLRYNQDLVVNLTHERNELVEDVRRNDKQVDKLSEIVSVVEMFEERMVGTRGSGPLSLSECEEMLADLQNKYPLEYKSYELSSLAVAVVFPKIKELLKGWDMLNDPVQYIDLFSVWRELLQEQPSSNTMPEPDNMDPYDRLIWEVWMTHLRSLLNSQWSPKLHSGDVVDLLETWLPLLPEWVLINILECIVLPKLQQEVDSWDPTIDPIPIHSWIHPWLPLMKERLELLYVPIRCKLATALTNWHPSDESALIILQPWVKVFPPESMEVFLLRTIVPKLAACLQALPINPQEQQIGAVEWVLKWKKMVSHRHIVSLFENHFFPRWLQCLSSWLIGAPNYDEVTRWYTGWKSMFNAELLSDIKIKANFNRALDLMNHAVSGTRMPGTRENVAYFTSAERRMTADLRPPPRTAALQNAISAPASLSFKDLVERKAEEAGVLFMPVPGQRRFEGKALYSFGKATIFIDRGVVFVLQSGQWGPVSLDHLVELS